MIDREKLREYLANKGLSAKSVSTYLKIINVFDKEFNEVSIDNINKFQELKQMRNAKSAFKHLLAFLGWDKKAYLDITTVKEKPATRKYIMLSLAQMQDIISRIIDERYKLMATVQFVTGCRAVGVIRLNTKNIYEKEDGVLLTLWEKHNKERSVFLPKPYSDQLLEYIKKVNVEYPFIRGLSKHGFDGSIENAYLAYYNILRKAFIEAGYDKKSCLGTHNWRVNWVSDVYEVTKKDLIRTQQAVGHGKPEQTARYISKFVGKDDSKEIIKQIRSAE